MRPETTLEMIYRWLLDGKKIRNVSWGKAEFMHLINGMTYDESETPITYEFEGPHEWELYQEPQEKVKWYQVISYNKKETRPYSNQLLFKSERDYLEEYGYSKKDFHFIKLIEVDCE